MKRRLHLALFFGVPGPPTIGGTWEQTVTVTTERQGQTSTEINARSCKVTGEATVTVAGGIFNTIKTMSR